MTLHTRWVTRPGVRPARFIYLATAGDRKWRVHAAINSTDSSGKGQIWLRQYYRDRHTASEAVSRLMAELEPDDWHCEFNKSDPSTRV